MLKNTTLEAEKVNEVQIVLGLLIDLEGSPVGFDIFNGSTFEGNTLKKAVEKIKERFGISRVIFVTDRAMLSKDNIEIIKGAGYEYIIGSRVKNKSKKIREEILSDDGYETKVVEVEDEVFKYKEIDIGGERLICTWFKEASREGEER